jgi:hypothetical protein
VAFGTGILLALMTLQFGEALYSQMVLIILFIIALKVRGNPLAETAKV